MRLLPALLSALLVSATLTSQIAHACGGYSDIKPRPRVLAMSNHGVVDSERWSHRSFIVLEQTAQIDDKTRWEMIAPGTFDPTSIITLAPLATPLEVTLVGPAGARVVKTDKQVVLGRSWDIGWDKARIALEVPTDEKHQFSIAIVGRASDATWHELDYKTAPASVRWSLGKLVADAESVALRTTQDTGFDIVEYFVNGNAQFVVRQGGTAIESASGSPLGMVTTKGRTFVVFSVDHQIGLLELPAAAATTKV
jgi:hypothetical protein